MRDDLSDIRQPSRPLTLAGLAVGGVAASAFLGGTTNAVNGAVSPTYFVTNLPGVGADHAWQAAIAHGIFEGILFGIVLSLIFTVSTGLITSVSCSAVFAGKHLLGVLGGAYVCWTLGGMAAVGLASLSPEWYRRTFLGVPEEFGEMLRYAWVGGSIWGAQFGGFVSVIIGLVILRANWRRGLDRPESPEPENLIERSSPDHRIKSA